MPAGVIQDCVCLCVCPAGVIHDSACVCAGAGAGGSKLRERDRGTRGCGEIADSGLGLGSSH